MLSALHSLSNDQGFKRYFKNTSWMFAEQILRLTAGLLVGVWVIRYLGPKQFGVFSYVLAFTAIFSGIARLGLDSILVRDLVNAPLKRDVYLGTAFWLKVTGAIVAFGAIAFFSLMTSNYTTVNCYIFIISFGMIFQSFEVIDFYFQSKVLSKYVSLCKITQLFFSSIIKIYLVFTGADLFWFVFVSFIDQVTLGISLAVAYKTQDLGSFYRYFDVTVAKRLLNNSWPFIFSGLVIMVYMRIDQIMIEKMLGVKEVGLYAAAVRLSEVWYFIPFIITKSLFPAIVSAKQISLDLYHTRLQRLYTSLVWMALAVAIPMTFFSDWLVVLLYGEAFKEAGKVLMIHIWAGVFVSLSVASGSWFINEDLQRYAFYRNLLGSIVNIILNLILIRNFGLIGAAISTVIAQSMAALFFDVLTKKTRITFFMKLKTFYFASLLQKG